VRVAVIDSGVHAVHPHIQGVAGGVGIDASGAVHDDFVDRLGHGTAVAAVIREKAPSADILAIKVFERELRTSGDALVTALRWARQNGARLANLSLGTTNTSHEAALAEELEAASASGMIVVAAAAQPDARWLPGSLALAVAVEADMTMSRDRCEVMCADGGRVRMRASGYPRPIPGVPPERNLKGVSFAVANATGFLALLFEGQADGTDIRAALGSVSSTSPSG
jgi:subtilisin family serine protease